MLKEDLAEEQKMGDSNQFKILIDNVPTVSGKVLEIGSKNYGNTTSFRDHYTRNEYVGLDLEAGDGVDVIVDLTKGIGSLQENSFSLAICCSVMEHTDKPWVMAQNISRLLKKDGLLFVSVPWVWRYHKYPDDYFRYSPAGIKALYDEFEWTKIYYHTTAPGEIFDVGKAGFENKLHIVLRTDEGHMRKYLPCVMISMIGQKRAGQQKKVA
jgi:SAM-dependent methyltransferase